RGKLLAGVAVVFERRVSVWVVAPGWCAGGGGRSLNCMAMLPLVRLGELGSSGSIANGKNCHQGDIR
ncbi:hypothetical protein SERLA73DRAFT_130663, partial [Serpula lacrymans var. lacrymans S7.3]